jgi:hypothetical protein
MFVTENISYLGVKQQVSIVEFGKRLEEVGNLEIGSKLGSGIEVTAMLLMLLAQAFVLRAVCCIITLLDGLIIHAILVASFKYQASKCCNFK